MFVDLISYFSQIPDFQQAVLAGHQLGKGMYIIVEDKKIKGVRNVDKEQPEGEDYEWLQAADYYSQLVDMNKAVDSEKKIHSCNPFAVFIKADILPEYGAADKVLSKAEFVQAIERYYETLLKGNKNDSKAAGILENARIKDIEASTVLQCRDWILENLDAILKTVQDKPPVKGGYLKIFFYRDISDYEDECRRYLLPKIFNKNDFNIIKNNSIYGLSNSNMGMNAKKPYLELMSTKFKVPFLINIDDAITLKCFFEWITNYKTSDGKSISSMYIFHKSNDSVFKNDLNKFVRGYFLHLKRGKETLVTDFEYLPLNPDIDKKYNIDDVLELESWGYSGSYNIWQLEKIIDAVFFSNRLIVNYMTDTSDMKSIYRRGEYSKELETLMLKYRKALHNFFRKGDEKAFAYCVDQMSRSVLYEILKMDGENGYWKSAAAFNLRIALLEQFNVKGDRKMGSFIKELLQIVRNKRDLDNEQPECENDEEFYFVCGQLTRYFFSLSEAAEPRHSMIESFLRAKDAGILKRKLKESYFAYGHEISLNSKRFDKLWSMVMGYKTNSVVREYDDYFNAGFVSTNLFYEKKDKQEGEKDENAE